MYLNIPSLLPLDCILFVLPSLLQPIVFYASLKYFLGEHPPSFPLVNEHYNIPC